MHGISYITFTDILELPQKNIDVDGLIQAKAQELRSMEAHKALSEDKLQNLAYSEAVAEMMETELTDTDAISRISRKLKQEDKSLWGRIKDFLKGLVDNLKKAYQGLTPDSRIAATTREAIASSEAILNAYVDAAADSVENYNLQEGQKSNALEDERKSSRYDYTKSFSEQVDDWKINNFPKNDALLVGTTPSVFIDLGLSKLPVTINQAHIEYVLNGTKDIDHALGEKLLKQLPTLMQKPLAIIPSDTHPNDSVVAILDAVNPQNGKQIIFAAQIDGISRQNTKRIDALAIKTIFGKWNAFTKLLSDAISNEVKNGFGVFYIDKNKTTAYLTGAGLQLPGSFRISGGLIHKITDSGSPVKLKLSDVTESQQFKRWFGDWQNHPENASQIVNEDGTPKIIYHQTGKEFHVFSNANPMAGMNDSETPNGFFAKDNDADIGIGGKKQMALYGDMKKPLHFKNRAEARAWYEKHVDGYAALQKQHDQINLQFQEEYEQQETDSDKYYEENYNAYVANDPAVTNAILENEKKLDDILDGWKEASVSISRQQRELLNEYFLKHDSGYDGIILDVDEGENGKPVKSYIFFNNTQLKSATGNIGTFDKANQDIRYSSRNPQKQMEAWETENERLKLEVEYLQKVVQIHKQGNRDYALDKNSLKSHALDLMKSNNAKGDTSELADIMDELYRYFATDENWQWDELQEKAGKAADWLMEHQKHRLEDYAQSALDWMAKRHVRLNDTQLAEIQYQFGSLSEFKKAVKGMVIIDQQAAMELDQLWQEGAKEYGYLFDKSVSDADMPRTFAELVQGLKESKSADQAELEQIKKAHERNLAQLRTQYGEDTKTMQTEFIRLLREYDASGALAV